MKDVGSTLTNSHAERLSRMTATRSWKVTRPLRWANTRAQTHKDSRATRPAA